MYGTVGKIKVKEGKRDELVKLSQGMRAGRDVDGFIAGYVFTLDNDPDGAIMVAVFQDKATYLKNADDPAQDADFRTLRELMVADPEWNDGRIVSI